MLPWLAGFEFVDHAPEAVGFAALDDLDGSRTPEGGIGGFEPGADGGGLDQFGESGEQALGFGEAAFGRRRARLAIGPAADGAGRKARKARKGLLRDGVGLAKGFDIQAFVGADSAEEERGRAAGWTARGFGHGLHR